MDSGNLFADLISEKLAKLMKLQIVGTPRTVGTANATGSVTILGKTRPFKMYLENISEAVIVQPYVVKDLAHPVNLGQSFLRKHKADMNFRQEGIQLKVGNSSTLLTTASAQLTRSTIDTRIQNVLNKLKEQGGNPSYGTEEVLDLRVNSMEPEQQPVLGVDYNKIKRTYTWGETKTRVHNCTKVFLPAQHDVIIKVQRGKQDRPASTPSKESNSVFLSPKMNCQFMNKKKLFVHPGIYTRDQNYIKLKISNYGHEDVYLPKGCVLGRILEAEDCGEDINVLDHRPAEELDEREEGERRAYIIDMLKLDENPLLEGKADVKEEIIQIFMDNWTAVSINDADFGKTDLIKFRIEISKEQKPIRAKLRPLNPFQEQDLRR